MQRWIMHVDMDAFFASVEQHDKPELQGLPVIVGGLTERGVVTTCSYEARVFGVHSAMPMVEAKRLCPQAVFLQGRMQRYSEVSQQIMQIFDKFSPLVEQLSIDEAFLDITGMEYLAGDVLNIGKQVKEVIYNELGLTASVGIAPNKFLAKMASDLRKPDGLVIVNPSEAVALLAPMSVRKIFGIGRSAERLLAQFGIITIGQIATADQKILRKALGSSAEKVQLLALGIDNRPVINSHEPKSIGKEKTFSHDLSTEEEWRHAVLDLCGQVGWRVRKHRVVGYTVTLKIKLASFKVLTRSISSEQPIIYDEEIFALAEQLLQKVNIQEGVRLLGVTLSRLERVEEVSQMMFLSDERLKNRNSAVDILKRKFGENIIKRGL